MDVDPDSLKLDFLVQGHSLPIRDGWSDELLSVHMIEHVPPPVLKEMLREWFRILKEGAAISIHTPNGEALARALLDSATEAQDSFWAVQSAIFGYAREPAYCTGPERLRKRGDHRMLLTFPILRGLLKEAGFSQIEDISGRNPCYHAMAWEPYVPGLCLEVRAVKAEAV